MKTLISIVAALMILGSQSTFAETQEASCVRTRDDLSRSSIKGANQSSSEVRSEDASEI